MEILAKNPNYLEKLDKLLERVPSLCQLSQESESEGDEKIKKKARMNMDIFPVKKVFDSSEKLGR